MHLIFTVTDRKILIEKTELPLDLRRKISQSPQQPLNLAPSELAALTATTLKAYTRHNNPKTRQEIKQVLNKILAAGEDLFSTRTPETTINKAGHKAPPLIGGLSPKQVSLLIHQGWSPVTPGVQLNYDLTTDEVSSTSVISRAQIFLQALGQDGIKATTAGNLSRKFVDSMIDLMDFSDDYVKYLNSYNKVLNESDVAPLLTLRAVLELAEIIELKGRRFRVTDMGRELMEPGSEGGLFLVLFVTWFREFNLAFGDRILDIPEFQDTLGYSLYRLSTLDQGWHDHEEMSQQLILPTVAAMIPTEPFNFRTAMVDRRFLRNLELFGLVELRLESDSETLIWYRPLKGFRRTELFDRFVGFEFS